MEESFDIAVDMIGQGRPDLANVRPAQTSFDIYVHDNFFFSIPRDGREQVNYKKPVRENVVLEIKQAINRHYNEEILLIG